MRTFSPTEDLASAAGLRHGEIHVLTRVDEVNVREIIAGSGPFYDPFLSASWRGDVDQPVQSGQFRFHLGQGGANLSPYMEGGAQLNGRPLFDSGRYFTLLTSIHAPGAAPNFRRVFRGRIDTADPADENDDVLVISCRDIYSDLLDDRFQPAPALALPIGPNVVDLVLQEMLSHSSIGGFQTPGASQQFTVLGTPSLFVGKFAQGPDNILPAMRKVGLNNGWDLRGRWGVPGFVDDDFTLTYYQPDRAGAGGAFEISPSRYDSIQGMPKARGDVRNHVTIIPTDPPRLPVSIFDQASIDLYGFHPLLISEDFASHISTPAEALTLAQIILAELKDPPISHRVNMGYFPWVEVNDWYRFAPNGVHYNVPLTLATQAWEHHLTSEDNGLSSGETVLFTRATPVAANEEWRDQVAKQSYVSLLEPDGPGLQGAQWDQILDDTWP